MEPLDPKNPESYKRINEIIARIASEWKGQANIIDIVPALKTSSKRVHPDKLVIGFRVAEKVRSELLNDRGYTPIPPEIEGIQTDIILARGTLWELWTPKARAASCLTHLSET